MSEKMDINMLNKLVKLAQSRLYSNDVAGALDAAKQIEALEPNWLISYYLSGLLIDIGSCANDERLINKGKVLLEKDYAKIATDNRLAPFAAYNLANGCLALFRFQIWNKQNIFFLQNDNLHFAKHYYREALRWKAKKDFTAQVLVNLGYCFDYIGRVVEALDCYDQSLKLRPSFGMALGNKGKALYYYADLCGEHQGSFLIEAYALLKSAQSDVTEEALGSFSQLAKTIEKRGKNLPLNNPRSMPGLTYKGRSNFEKYLIAFCLNNQLYLNICSFCKKCNAAIGDTVTIRMMTVPANDYSYLVFSSYLNEIKQDYITARALVVMSKYEGLNLDFMDKFVTIANTFDESTNDIYTQLTKTSFKTFYDILDKIAFFINDYLKLNIPEDQVNFSTIWYTSRDRKEIKQAILKTKNPSLNALYDVHKDLDYGTYRILKYTRNSLTHRFVKIMKQPVSETSKVMGEETLYERTLDLARIVRNSIIYLLQFVQVEEQKKNRKMSQRTIKIPIPTIPYQKKKRRTKRRIQKSVSKNT